MYQIVETKIEETMRSIGFERNPKNKKIKDDFKNNRYSINEVKGIPDFNNHIGTDVVDMDIAFEIVSTEGFDKAKNTLDMIVSKLSEIYEVLSFNNVNLSQLNKNPLKLIGNLNFITLSDKC